MKVCILTTVHPPYNTRVFHKEAVSIAKVHDVIEIAPFNEKIDDTVNRVKITTIKKPKRKVFHPLTIWNIFKKGLDADCDVYHCFEPSSLFVCLLIKAIKKKRVIYDGHEHYPSLIAENSLFPNFIRPMIKYLADGWEKFLVRYADAVITVDKILFEKYQKYNKNVHVLPNYPKLDLIKPDIDCVEENRIIYVGGISRDRGLYQILKLAENVNIPIVCVGAFTDELNKVKFSDFTKKNPVKNITFTGRLPYSEAMEAVQCSKVGLSLLQPIPRYQIAVPSKLFEYMGYGKPVVISDFPLVRDIIDDVECGVLVDPTNPDGIIEAIQDLMDHPDKAKQMGKNGQRAVRERFNWGKMEEKLLAIYESQI